MTLFQYPKNKHNRNLSPRKFKRYQTYKRYLQTEFFRVCVYCRQPDSSAPNLNFGVDHYKPKGIARFANLMCSYENLYYCCGNCNSRKNNDWPQDEKVGPYIVNPCDYEMGAHLRFNSNTGKVESRTTHGKHTEELLQLNDEATVQYRLGTLTTVRLFSAEIKVQEQLLQKIHILFRKGKISNSQYDINVSEIKQAIAELRVIMETHTGELPLLPLKKQKQGVSLLSP